MSHGSVGALREVPLLKVRYPFEMEISIGVRSATGALIRWPPDIFLNCLSPNMINCGLYGATCIEGAVGNLFNDNIAATT
ncbi:MAG: hypothetical protein CUN55_17290 [Phototrophicales bacterium]|nr:MAG: hypothetical protein CUN55_17290 [Phototrophicales bacterium]